MTRKQYTRHRILTYTGARYVSFYHEMTSAEDWDQKIELIIDEFNDARMVRDTKRVTSLLILSLAEYLVARCRYTLGKSGIY